MYKKYLLYPVISYIFMKSEKDLKLIIKRESASYGIVNNKFKPIFIVFLKNRIYHKINKVITCFL